MDLSILIATGAVTGFLMALAIPFVLSMLSFKFITRKAWQVSAKFGLWIVITGIILGAASTWFFHFGAITSFIIGGVVWLCIAKYKFSTDWMDGLKSYGAYILMTIIVSALFLGAALGITSLSVI